jgi:hypothetical protein
MRNKIPSRWPPSFLSLVNHVRNNVPAAAEHNDRAANPKYGNQDNRHVSLLWFDVESNMADFVLFPFVRGRL